MPDQAPLTFLSRGVLLLVHQLISWFAALLFTGADTPSILMKIPEIGYQDTLINTVELESV